MSMTSIPYFTPSNGIISGGGNYTTLDALNEKIGHCALWTTPDGAQRTITHICFGVFAVSGSDSYTVQLESINTSTGIYNGLIASGASGTQTVSAQGWYEVELSTPYVLTSGTYAAVTITKTANNSNYIHVTTATSEWFNGVAGTNLSWVVNNLGSGDVKANYRPNAALKCSTGEYLIPPSGNCETISTSLYCASGNNPYSGNKIVVPTSMRLVACKAQLSLTQDFYIKLFDASGNLLKGDDSTTDMTIDMTTPMRGATSQPFFTAPFPCPKTLSADTTYYLLFQARSSTGLLIYYDVYNSTTLLQTALRLPSTWTMHRVYGSTVTGLTSQTMNVTNIYPVFDQIDIGSAGFYQWACPILD